MLCLFLLCCVKLEDEEWSSLERQFSQSYSSSFFPSPQGPQDSLFPPYLQIAVGDVAWHTALVQHTSSPNLFVCRVQLVNNEWVWVKGVAPGLDTQSSASKQAVESVLHEAQVLSQLRSFYLPMFFGLCLTVPHPFLVLEYIPGISLRDLTTSSGLEGEASMIFKSVKDLLQSWELRWQLVADIVVGLSVLHSHIPHSLTHGDLRSANFLVDTCTLRGKLTGLSRARSSEKTEEAEIENLKKAEVVTLGGILTELACMRDVFAGGSQPSCYADVADKLPEDLPEDWRELLEKCFTKCSIKKVFRFLEKRKKMENRFGSLFSFSPISRVHFYIFPQSVDCSRLNIVFCHSGPQVERMNF